ncbi:MAG: hypothetical protein KKC37_11045 [Proteobacteria bacterium]|nr:hypothetical protein [Pseudomonadota bacterium]
MCLALPVGRAVAAGLVKPTAKAPRVAIPAPPSGRWVLFRPGVSQFMGSRPLKVEGDCRTVALLELYHQARLIAGERIRARNYTVRVCCRAKTVQILGSIHIDLQGKPALKLLRPRPKTRVDRNPVLGRIHRLACRLPLGPSPSSAKPTGPEALLSKWCDRYGLKITTAKGKMIHARIVDLKLFGKLGIKKSRKGGRVLINRLGPTKVRLRLLSSGQSKVFLLGR